MATYNTVTYDNLYKYQWCSNEYVAEQMFGAILIKLYHSITATPFTIG